MNEIDQSKIGKKDEKLVGWDYLRQKKLGTNYPPMRARGAKPNRCRTSSNYDSSGFYWILLLVIICVIGTKILGIW